jgi:hypothetical protein
LKSQKIINDFVQFLAIRLLTNGKIAALVGARTEGNFSTVLVEPSSNVSSFNEVAKQPRTFGLILLKFPLHKEHNLSIQHQNTVIFYPKIVRVFKSKSVLE